MNKNIIIALLAGLLIGTNLPRANAETASISRADFFAEIALLGILVNQANDPERMTFGAWGAGISKTKLARDYANNMLEGK